MLIKLPITTPTLLLNPNPKRTKFSVQMQAELVDAANTGMIFVGIGFQPTPTVGEPLQGEVLIQSAVIERPRVGEPLTEREKGAVWAVSNAANQTLVVEEESGVA